MTSPLHTDQSRGEAVTLTLPWPDRKLSPNARLHWAQKAGAVKAARQTAWALLRQASGPHGRNWTGAKLNVTFCPPDKRRRDLDNCIASFKSSNDGLADGLGIDDSRFVSTYQLGEPVKGGAVLVTVRGIE